MVHILSYNIYCPPMITTKEHVSQICEFIKRMVSKNMDVPIIALTEVFQSWVRNQILKELRNLSGKWKVTPIVHKGTVNVSSGLMVLWNTEKVVRGGKMHTVEYKRCFQLDCFSNKGAVHVPFTVIENSVPINLIVTHMQAWTPECMSSIRSSQFEQLGALVKSIPNKKNVIIVGDFNENPNMKFSKKYDLQMPVGNTFLNTYENFFFDHAYANCKIEIEKVVDDENPSDHSPVLININNVVN